MSAVETSLADEAAGAAAAGIAALGKRKADEMEFAQTGPDTKAIKGEPTPMPTTAGVAEMSPEEEDSDKKAPMSKAREVRLEQNRKAARESRRRKKTMIEELQRSVIFFSRANSTLKQQNDELSRLLIQSQAQVAAIESGQQAPPAAQAPEQPQQQSQGQPGASSLAVPASSAPGQNFGQVKAEGNEQFHQAQAQAVATQAVLESQVCSSGSCCFLSDVGRHPHSRLTFFAYA